MSAAMAGSRESTILTTDIVSSTALLRRYPNDMLGAMDLHDRNRRLSCRPARPVTPSTTRAIRKRPPLSSHGAFGSKLPGQGPARAGFSGVAGQITQWSGDTAKCIEHHLAAVE
jgi:hypothetical protein